MINRAFDNLFFVDMVMNILPPHPESSLNGIFIAPHEVISNLSIRLLSLQIVMFAEIVFLLFLIL